MFERNRSKRGHELTPRPSAADRCVLEKEREKSSPGQAIRKAFWGDYKIVSDATQYHGRLSNRKLTFSAYRALEKSPWKDSFAVRSCLTLPLTDRS